VCVLFEALHFLAILLSALALLGLLPFTERIEKHDLVLLESTELVRELGLFLPFLLLCNLRWL
jgi:hypothetical protein